MKIVNLSYDITETLDDDDRVYILKLDSRKFKRRKPNELCEGDVFHLKGEDTCQFVETVFDDGVIVRNLNEVLPSDLD
jgi:hypothetical protein